MKNVIKQVNSTIYPTKIIINKKTATKSVHFIPLRFENYFPQGYI